MPFAFTWMIVLAYLYTDVKFSAAGVLAEKRIDQTGLKLRNVDWEDMITGFTGCW
jgi:hypothetical protein